ncbi:MAG: hypothetical protein ABH852_04875 [Methanobacteriota archaeon]
MREMVRLSRINSHGVFLIKKGHKWIKQRGSQKPKKWSESSKPKKEKE